VKRWVAALFLVVIAFYSCGEGVDRCLDNAPDEAQVCHLLCSDGCSTAPIPAPPLPPSPDPIPGPAFERVRFEQLVSLCTEPEKDPPRA
jgi:hypothetical protein